MTSMQAHCDFWQVAKLLRILNMADRDALLDALCWAERIVKANWRVVVNVACRLYACQVLDNQSLMATLDFAERELQQPIREAMDDINRGILEELEVKERELSQKGDQMSEQDAYMTTSELSLFLKVSRKFIEKHRQRIPGVRIGKTWRYSRIEIEKRILSGQLLLPEKRG